ncbi:MAG TPA: tetratricopeptide repeat protein [Bacteroidia bacterium]|jgi:tetratricopeptide (TPR) repeat protein
MLKRVVFLVGLFLSVSVFAQKTNIYTHEDAEFKNGIELFQKEKYGAAQKSFIKVVESHKDPQSLIRIDAEYYNALCAIELFNKDGELYLKQFVIDHPESPKVKTAYFYLGKYNFRKKKYRDAINWLEKVDIYDLTTEELAEFYFKRGYSFFELNKFPEAKKDFFEIKDVDNSYAASAKYYYAHIAYNEKNYETALTDFLKLERNETFGPVVPYYIAQIYFLQGKYETVITYAPALLDSAVTKRAPEIARILGESYYRTSRYKESIPYLKRYEKSAGALSRKDNYQMGFAHYKLNEYEDAINYFLKVGNIDDSLEQNAYYHIGDCYLKTGNKQNALNAFGLASKLDFDKAIQEDALYNYAKLSYELAFNPYNEAIRAFQKYIKNFPNAPHIDEAYTYLANVFITTKSYKEALEALESIKVLTPELKQAHQKVAYYRGVDLFNNMQYDEAIKLFDKSMTYLFDKNIRASAVYWKAESYYRSEKYPEAIDTYLDYISEPGAIGKSELSDANYNIGYCYYKTKDYTSSILWFRKFVTFKPMANAKKINDAYNRIGDGYFMTKDYANAADYYDQSYKMKLMNPDYALFQRALANGVQKKYSAKISDLTSLVTAYPKSLYIQKAKFELAQAYYTDNQNDLALEHFKKFIEEYPNSAYINVSLSKVGLIYYGKKENENALASFDKLIKRDRTSPEAIGAINTVKEILQGDPERLSTVLASYGASIPQGQLDSLTYNNGRNHYMSQDCKSVIVDFEKYIQKFPEGIFIRQANFYKAKCELQLGNQDAALAGFSFVISKPRNEHTEESLLLASEIAFKKQNYALAIDYYKQLELQAENPKSNSAAIIGLMRSYVIMKNPEEVMTYSNKVLKIENVSNELKNEAHYNMGHSYLSMQKLEEAQAEFQAVANSSKAEIGAEAQYHVANIFYLKKEYKQSKKVIFDFINGDGDYPYWVTKAMILLADDYVALNDNFQAKGMLKGIIDESNIPELIKIAQEKLNKIMADEEAAKQLKTVSEPLKVGFEGNTPEQDKLFTEPSTVPKDTKEGEPKHD